MIEITVLTHLQSVLTAVPVYMEIPAVRPATFIVVTKTGGGEDDHIRSAMIVLDCYSTSMLAAGELCESAIAAMGSLTGSKDVSACQLNSSYNDTDTANKEYCYGALFDIYY